MVLRKEEEREESRDVFKEEGLCRSCQSISCVRAGSVFLEIAVYVNGIFCDIAPSDWYGQVRVPAGSLCCRCCRAWVTILQLRTICRFRRRLLMRNDRSRLVMAASEAWIQVRSRSMLCSVSSPQMIPQTKTPSNSARPPTPAPCSCSHCTSTRSTTQHSNLPLKLSFLTLAQLST